MENFKKLFYFDIETTSKYPDLETLKNDDFRGYELFIKKCDRNKLKHADWNKDENVVYLEKSPLLPEFGKIICFSYAYYNEGDFIVRSLPLDIPSNLIDYEKILLENVSKLFLKVGQAQKSLCGFNIKGFDIPWLNRKFYNSNSRRLPF